MSLVDVATALEICMPDRRQHFLDLQQLKADNPHTQFYIHLTGCYSELLRVRIPLPAPPTDPMAISSSAATPAATPPVTRSDQRSAKEEAVATSEGALQNQASTVLL